MDDGYQDVIRGSPVDRKPDRAVLDAAFGAEMQAPGPLHWYNPAVYTQAVAGATLAPNVLIKHSFDRSIACSIGGVDIARIEYHSTSLGYPPLVIRQSTEPRAFHQRPESMRLTSQAHESRGDSASHASEPSVARVNQEQSTRPPNDSHPTRPHNVQRHPSAHQVDTQVNSHTPAHPLTQPRVRRASPLPEQKAAWADHKRGRDRCRRSRSPPTDRQNQTHATNYRRRASSVSNDQFEDATLHGRPEDHGHASHSNTTGDLAYDNTYDDAHEDAHDYGVRHTPGPGNSTVPAPAHLLPPSTSETQHNPRSTELCSKRDVDHTTNYHPPEPPFESDHPSALESLPNDHGNHGHDIHENNHNRAQAKSNAHNAYASTSVLARPLLPSIIEPLQRKNQHAVCIECWSRDLKCDSRVVCGQCAKRARPCSYVQCPLRACPRYIMCPAYHSWRGDDETRVVGNPMHLMVLLRLGPPSSSPGYDLSEIQAMSGKHNSAQEIYRRIAAEIKEGEDSGKRIDNTFVKQLVLRCGVAVGSSDRAVMPKVKLIVDFVTELKKPRYQEPYKREQRALRFGPTS
ncbi:hypothetical protein KCU91_g2835, partial [Aureobasidium melanogenum]